MRHLLKSLVVGAVAVSASNAFAGGVPDSTSGTNETSASAPGSRLRLRRLQHRQILAQLQAPLQTHPDHHKIVVPVL